MKKTRKTRKGGIRAFKKKTKALDPMKAVLPRDTVGEVFILDVEGAIGNARERRGEKRVVEAISKLSNDDVLDGVIPFEYVAEATRLLALGKVHPNIVPAMAAGIKLYASLHLRGARNRLAIADRQRPDGALTGGGFTQDQLDWYADIVFPTKEASYQHSFIRIPERVYRNPAIAAFFKSVARFRVVVAGARSWKTMLAILFTIAQAIRRPDTSYFFAAPSLAQTKTIFWERLVQFTPRPMVHTVRDGDLIVRLVNGSSLHLKSLDVPERIEGKGMWHGCVVDETGDARGNIFDKHIRPMLADSGGFALVIGRARQTHSSHFRDLAARAESGAADYEFFTWKSADVLSADEIAAIMADLDPATFAAEYEGTWQDTEGRAYPYYDPETHKKERAVDFQRAFFVDCDFNVNPCIFEVGQVHDKRFVHVLDEVHDANTDTFKMAVLTKKKLVELFGKDEKRAMNHRVDFYGDYAGNSRTANAVDSSWEILKKEFKDWNVRFNLKPSPNVVDRLNAFNGRLRSADGEVHFSASAKCRHLHKDLEKVTREQLKKDKSTGDMTHASDGVGYMLEYILDHPPAHMRDLRG